MTSRFERMFFNSSIIDTDEYLLPSEERILLLSLQYEPYSYISPVFTQVRTHSDGEKYLEVIIYNERAFRTERYRRFVIRRGYVMGKNEEREFLFWMRDTHRMDDKIWKSI